MKIGDLVKIHGVSVDTIRFYEKQSLLAPKRLVSGYRTYTQTDSHRLGFILRAKSMGFSLAQISELLQIEDNKDRWQCADVKDKVQQKMNEIKSKMNELQQLYQSLQQLDDACCGGSVSATKCSILSTLASGKTTSQEQHTKD